MEIWDEYSQSGDLGIGASSASARQSAIGQKAPPTVTSGNKAWQDANNPQPNQPPPIPELPNIPPAIPPIQPIQPPYQPTQLPAVNQMFQQPPVIGGLGSMGGPTGGIGAQMMSGMDLDKLNKYHSDLWRGY